MGNVNIVLDDDLRFVIDKDTRIIVHPIEEKPILIQYDHNSERFTFEAPRIIDGYDITQCNLVRVHFINISADGSSDKSASLYEVDDLKVDPDDDTLVTFSWLIAQEATMHAGTLSFLVEFIRATDDRIIEYSWHTKIYEGVIVSNGFDNSEAIIGDRYDILDTWVAQFENRLDMAGQQVESKLDLASQQAESRFEAFVNDTLGELLAENLMEREVLSQTTGDNPSKVMSQKAVTDNINAINARISQSLGTNGEAMTGAYTETFLFKSPASNVDFVSGAIELIGAVVTITIDSVHISAGHYTDGVKLGNIPMHEAVLPDKIEWCVYSDISSNQPITYSVIKLSIETDGSVWINESNSPEQPEEVEDSIPLTTRFISLNDQIGYMSQELLDLRIDRYGNTHETMRDAIVSQFDALYGEFEETIINSVSSFTEWDLIVTNAEDISSISTASGNVLVKGVNNISSSISVPSSVSLLQFVDCNFIDESVIISGTRNTTIRGVYSDNRGGSTGTQSLTISGFGYVEHCSGVHPCQLYLVNCSNIFHCSFSGATSCQTISDCVVLNDNYEILFDQCKYISNISGNSMDDIPSNDVDFKDCEYLSNINILDANYENCSNVDVHTCYGYKDISNIVYGTDSTGDQIKFNLNDELDKKLDKSETVPSSDSAYIEKKGGGQGLLAIISGNPVPETIVRRNSSGQIATADPTEDTHAANKKYVDENAGVKDATVGSAVLRPDANGRLKILLDTMNGLKYTTSGITIDPLYAPAISSRTNSITSFNAVYIDSMVKAAMCDGQGAAWTDAEKEAACERMGAAMTSYVDEKIASSITNVLTTEV